MYYCTLKYWPLEEAKNYLKNLFFHKMKYFLNRKISTVLYCHQLQSEMRQHLYPFPPTAQSNYICEAGRIKCLQGWIGDLCQVQSPDLCQVQSPDLCQVLQSPELCQGQSPDLCQVLQSPDLCQVLQSPDLCQVQSPDLCQVPSRESGFAYKKRNPDPNKPLYDKMTTFAVN